MKNNAVIARPVRTLVVAIPRLVRKCTEKHPKEWALPKFLAVIVTWFHGAGDCHATQAHWLAMTGNFGHSATNTNLLGRFPVG